MGTRGRFEEADFRSVEVPFEDLDAIFEVDADVPTDDFPQRAGIVQGKDLGDSIMKPRHGVPGEVEAGVGMDWCRLEVCREETFAIETTGREIDRNVDAVARLDEVGVVT